MRKLFHWTWVLVVLALLYTGTTILVRWRENQSIEEEALRRKTEADRQTVNLVGGGEMKVLAFYASPAALAVGQKGLLCYGVASAKSVRIEPYVDGAGPAISRCLEIHPKRTTTYTLTATAANGRTDRREVEVPVR